MWLDMKLMDHDAGNFKFSAPKKIVELAKNAIFCEYFLMWNLSSVIRLPRSGSKMAIHDFLEVIS